MHWQKTISTTSVTKWKPCKNQIKSSCEAVKKPRERPHVERYPLKERQTSISSQQSELTHNCWSVTRYMGLLGPLWSLCIHTFIQQATQSCCQNSQFPVHLHNRVNVAKTQTVKEFAGCTKLTTTTVLGSVGRQQPVRLVMNGSIWWMQVEELLKVIIVIQSSLKCKALILKRNQQTKGNVYGWQ